MHDLNGIPPCVQVLNIFLLLYNGILPLGGKCPVDYGMVGRRAQRNQGVLPSSVFALSLWLQSWGSSLLGDLY